MRILLFCSWLILLGALEEPNWSEPTGEPRVNASYEDFRKRHIAPGMTADKCDSEIRRKQIYNHPDKSCKETNTFIFAYTNKVKDICKGQQRNDIQSKLIWSKKKFSIVVCKLKNNARYPWCEYRGKLLENRKVEVACVRGLPVHYVKHEVPEPDQIPEPDHVPEPDQIPEPDHVPDPDQVPEPDHVPDPDQVPEPDHVPDPDQVPEPDQIPDPDQIPEPDPVLRS